MCKERLPLALLLGIAVSVMGGFALAGPVPPPWTNQDIGSPLPGSADYDGETGAFTIIANGDDIWNNSDNFHFVHQRVLGDCNVVARVVSNEPYGTTTSNQWKKAGVMIRRTLDAGSVFADEVISDGGGGGESFQWRPVANLGCISSHTHTGIAPPHWVRIERSGDDFTGYFAPDVNGIAGTWSQEGGVVTIPMGVKVYVGLAVTSHESAALVQAVIDNVTIERHPYYWAYDPIPADGAMNDSTMVVLIWTPGEGASTHDLYFHSDKNLVDTLDPSAKVVRVNPAAFSELIIGLVRGRTYYWRIVEQPGDHAGPVWRFTVTPLTAYNPAPPDGATFISLDPTLEWYPGSGSLLHAIYFGTDFNDVNDRVFGGHTHLQMQPDANWAPVGDTGLTIQSGTNYFWRIDESTDGMVWHKGDTWSFRTKPFIPIIDPNLYGWWKLDEGQGTDVFDWSGHGRDGTFRGDPQWAAGNCGGALEFDGSDDYVNIDGCKGILGGHAFSITAWIRTTDDEGEIVGWGNPSGTQRVEFRVNENRLRCEHGSGNRQGDTNVNNDEWHHVAVTVKENATISYPEVIIYLDGEDDTRTGTDPDAFNIVANHDVKIARRYNADERWFGGLIDDVRIYDKELTQAEIKWIMQCVPLELAGNPSPGDGELMVEPNTVLSWSPGIHAQAVIGHLVYFGTSFADVNERKPAAYVGALTSPVHDPLGAVDLAVDTRYYWAIDEVNVAGPAPYKWPGYVWSFQTVRGEPYGKILREVWLDITGTAVGDLTGDPCYPEYPDITDELSMFEGPIDWQDNYGTRIHGWLHPKTSGYYEFWLATDDNGELLLSPDASPLKAELIAHVPGWTSPRQWEKYPGDQNSVPIWLDGGGRYYICALQKEGGGLDNVAVAWQGPDCPQREVISGYWLSRYIAYWAYNPSPRDGAIVEEMTFALEWSPGIGVQPVNGHELYIADNFADVNNRTAAKIVLTDPYYLITTALNFGETYYWAVDEVNSAGPQPQKWEGTVWSFTMVECLVADDMEDYNDRGEIRQVWRDGYANVIWGPPPTYRPIVRPASSGSNVGVCTAVGGPVYAGTESMALYYDNDGDTYVPGAPEWYYDAPYFSEIEANTVGPSSLGIGEDWTAYGLRALSLWHRGRAVSDGNSSYSGGEYRINGRGTDIWGTYDEFHYVCIPFSGIGSIVARVMSVENTDGWAKAGLMIRQDLTPQSIHAMVVMTPGNGVAFQRRLNPGGASTNTNIGGITTPQWVRLVRGVGGIVDGQYSPDGINWTSIGSETMTWTDPMYVGLCVTSHNVAELCTADFNNVSPSLAAGLSLDIGTNDREPMYVALKDGWGNVAVVHHGDANAATVTAYQEWNIDLAEFAGVDLNSVRKVYIGLGDRNNPQQGGKGTIYVDDVRLCPPRCVAAFGPSADLSGDCLVGYEDLDILEDDWLMGDSTLYAQAVSPSDPNLTGYWEFEGNFNDSGPHGYHATDPCGSNPGYNTGVYGQAIEFDGVDDHLVVGSVGIDGNVPRTIAGWAKANTTAIPNWTPCFGFTSFTGGNDLSFDIQRRNYGSYCLHVYGWERDMMEVDLEWHHLAGTYDGTTLRWYGDGQHYGTDSSRMLNTEDNVQIGKRAHDAGGYWPGRIDDVRIYSRVLSHEEILSLAGLSELYFPLVSPANLYDQEPNNFKKVNFRDYGVMMDQWLYERLWPDW